MLDGKSADDKSTFWMINIAGISQTAFVETVHIQAPIYIK